MFQRLVPPLLPASILAVLLLLVLSLLSSGCGGGGDGGDADSTGVASAEGAPDGEAAPEDAVDSEEDEEGSDSRKRERPITVNAARVARGELVIPVIAEGAIRARKETEIKAEVGGRIESIHVEEGQRVEKGRQIARIDDRDYQIALEEANSRYLEALGKLAADGLDRGANPGAAVDLKAKLEELDRLREKGAITAEERRRKGLEIEVEAVKQGAYRDELVEVRSGLAAARADVGQAKLNLERTRITAPFSGVVKNLHLAAGERVTNEQKVCDLIDNVNIEADVAVLESDLAGLEVGRAALLEVPALKETLLVRVDVISPDIDSDSRTCRVLMRFQNEDGRIRPGMYVRAAIAGEIHPDRLLVPREAILTRDGRPLLFKVEGDRSEWVYVTLGLANERFVEIERVIQGGPLDPGDLVVVSDHLTLTHQALVKVKDVIEPTTLWASSADEE